MQFNKSDTALVVIDPQNDVLSEKGVSWALVGDCVKENNTVANIASLFKAAKDGGFGVFISPPRAPSWPLQSHASPRTLRNHIAR